MIREKRGPSPHPVYRVPQWHQYHHEPWKLENGILLYLHAGNEVRPAEIAKVFDVSLREATVVLKDMAKRELIFGFQDEMKGYTPFEGDYEGVGMQFSRWSAEGYRGFYDYTDPEGRRGPTA